MVENKVKTNLISIFFQAVDVQIVSISGDRKEKMPPKIVRKIDKLMEQDSFIEMVFGIQIIRFFCFI